ncbi:hypothetical protein AB0J38_33570 [Streptomyces sp. NPDC050095]|uniref:hypothetical protein n=1 Tax=unclassified Streptomyces TaxID=2593676 RepID=UPI0034313D64
MNPMTLASATLPGDQDVLLYNTCVFTSFDEQGVLPYNTCVSASFEDHDVLPYNTCVRATFLEEDLALKDCLATYAA